MSGTKRGLADHIKVTGAGLKDGLLTIELVREIPEAMKARKIEISGGNATQAIDAERDAAPGDKPGKHQATKSLENA